MAISVGTQIAQGSAEPAAERTPIVPIGGNSVTAVALIARNRTIGFEAQPGSDAVVVASVRRRPAHYPVLMVNRMLNGGITTGAGVDLLGLLRQVATNERASAEVREDAERYLDHQRRRAESL